VISGLGMTSMGIVLLQRLDSSLRKKPLVRDNTKKKKIYTLYMERKKTQEKFLLRVKERKQEIPSRFNRHSQQSCREEWGGNLLSEWLGRKGTGAREFYLKRSGSGRKRKEEEQNLTVHRFPVKKLFGAGQKKGKTRVNAVQVTKRGRP